MPNSCNNKMEQILFSIKKCDVYCFKHEFIIAFQQTVSLCFTLSFNLFQFLVSSFLTMDCKVIWQWTDILWYIFGISISNNGIECRTKNSMMTKKVVCSQKWPDQRHFNTHSLQSTKSEWNRENKRQLTSHVNTFARLF